MDTTFFYFDMLANPWSLLDFDAKKKSIVIRVAAIAEAKKRGLLPID